MAHEKYTHAGENRAPMIRYRSYKQLSLEEFNWPKSNRDWQWVTTRSANPNWT